MASPPRRRPRPPFPDHLLELILSRLPPEDPSCLLRASLVCKHWRDLIYAPSFFFHLQKLGRAPQMLGFLHDSDFVSRLEYVPTSPFSFPVPVPDRACWYLLGYRHGRAVFHSTCTENLSLLVWVPFTGQRTEVPVPAEFKIERSYATVICAADGCDHRNCHEEGPFLIVFVFCDPEDEDKELRFLSSACVYSSETGAWGELAYIDGVSLICDTPALLVGKSLLYFLSNSGDIVEYNLAQHSLVRIDAPYHDPNAAFDKRMILVQSENDGLGIVFVQPDPDTYGFSDDGSDCLCLLSRKVSEGGVAEWVELGVIYLEDSLSRAGGSTSRHNSVSDWLCRGSKYCLREHAGT